jgi:hypothetical protein
MSTILRTDLGKILIFRKDFNGAFYEIRNMGSTVNATTHATQTTVRKIIAIKGLLKHKVCQHISGGERWRACDSIWSVSIFRKQIKVTIMPSLSHFLYVYTLKY